MTKKAKIIITVVLSLLVVILAAGYYKFYFVFGEGVKAGELNYVVYKGYVFKTYEGKLIQSGFKGGKSASGSGIVQSYEFEFSVASKAIADSLMHCTSKNVELHYKEYNGSLPWRGISHYIVDSIVSVKDLN